MKRKNSQKVLFFHEFEIGQAILFCFQFGIFFFLIVPLYYKSKLYFTKLVSNKIFKSNKIL